MLLWAESNFVSLATLVLSVSALGITQQARATDIVTPSLNKKATAQVGGQVLHHGTYHQQAAIHLKQEIKFGERQQYSLTPGYYIRTAWVKFHKSKDSVTFESRPVYGDFKQTGKLQQHPGFPKTVRVR